MWWYLGTPVLGNIHQNQPEIWNTWKICLRYINNSYLNISSSLFYIRVVMVSMLVSGAVDYGLEPRSGQTKAYKIGICCISAKHAALRRKSKDWLARNQDNQSTTKLTSSSSRWKLTCSRHDIAEKLLSCRLFTHSLFSFGYYILLIIPLVSSNFSFPYPSINCSTKLFSYFVNWT